jgi:hypothetical protein
MAAPRKKKVATVKNESYSELEMYCIWLHEYYTSLTRAGFKSDLALTLIMEKNSYPEWITYGKIDIEKYLEEDED